MPDFLADTSLIVDLINDRSDRRNLVRQLLTLLNDNRKHFPMLQLPTLA